MDDPILDESLVFRAENLINGANTHDLGGALAWYRNCHRYLKDGTYHEVKPRISGTKQDLINLINRHELKLRELVLQESKKNSISINESK